MYNFDENTKKNIQEWLSEDSNKDSNVLIKELMNTNPSKLIDAFYKRLEFGTGGLRALMGFGTNRINEYTIRAATQGFANYLLKQKKEMNSIIIGYDTRINSSAFANEAAKVLAANGIQVYLFDKPVPTPLVSFGCRLKKCSGAIVITASHNPPEYNGFKVFWKDGAQVLPPHDINIIKEVNQIEGNFSIKTLKDSNDPLISLVGTEIFDAYLEVLKEKQYNLMDNQKYGSDLQIIYTSLHGTGTNFVPRGLNCWGFNNVKLVSKQCTPDGTFPTIQKPNPEDLEAMELGNKILIEENADILLVTDPDCDRIGVSVNHHNTPIFLTGNQIACLCTEHICNAITTQNKMPSNAAFIKTVVTTELMSLIATKYGAECFDTLTGFKYIAEIIEKWSHAKENCFKFIFGAEESHGYLLGDFVRDKDAISACALISEIALQAKLNGKTLIDLLNEIFKKYGFFYEKVANIQFKEGKEGHETMNNFMDSLRKNLPEEIDGIKVECLEDYASSIKRNLINGKDSIIELPKTNLLCLWLEKGIKIMIRPSGTEPKIKIYCEVSIECKNDTINELMNKCEKISTSLIKTINVL